jgi:DNA sulfur modification protein DndD
MIIDKLTLHNFGVYQNRQTITLTPPNKEKPIILFGGLNGTGKTTLLDALQLVLYGKQSNCSNRGHQPYESFLLNSINRNCKPTDGATLELVFRQYGEGVEHQYKVTRSWTSTGKSVRESLVILKNGEKDTLLTDNWPEMVETIIPSQISNLFFFDGEKIAEIADMKNASQFLSTGINSLLGLNIIEQLMADLSILERRKHTGMKKDVDQKSIKEAEEGIKRLVKEREHLTSRRGSLQLDFEKCEREIEELAGKYKKAGGEHFDNRVELEKQKKTLREGIKLYEDKLVEKAAGSLPLALVNHLLNEVLSQAEKEEEAHKSRMLVKSLSQRDFELLKIMKESKADSSILNTVKNHLETDRDNQEKQAASIQVYLNMTKEGTDQVKTLLQITLPNEKKETKVLVTELEALKQKLEEVEKQINAIPDPANLKGISESRRKLMASREQMSLKIEALDKEIHEVALRLKTQEQQVLKIIELAADEEFEQEDVRRMIIYLQRMQRIFGKFQEKILERNLEQLERLILESFQNLLRKDGLLHNLTINPKDFSLTLYCEDNKVIPPDRLSAGERQLLAVSMLWGLAKASGRPLPAIIDTPLGRLDSSHRMNLIKRYFPQASHQVILLSTDEEINAGHLEQLKESIGHTYRLDYDNKTKNTTVSQGYFW